MRARVEADGHTRMHVIGFAKLVGDLIDGLMQVALYFGLAALIAAVIIWLYTRCVRSTVLVIACSLVAVVWQLGLVAAFGFELDPYSILVPFLVFAIGVSHGAQKMNGIMQDIARGAHRLVAARYTFRRLFLAGLTALLADAVGFAVLMVIDIPVIKDLALTASIGVAVLIFTNLILLPVLLSYVGVSDAAAARALKAESDEARDKGFNRLFAVLGRFVERRWALAAVAASALLLVVGYAVSTHLKIGDLDPGAPELRADSRYNRDNAYITGHYSLSSDTFAVIVKTDKEGCLKYQTLVEADRLAWELQQVPGVQTTAALTNAVRQITAGSNEGSPKWLTIARNQDVLNYGAQQASVNNPELFNTDCSVMPVIAYLADHRAETLDRVVQASSAFAAEHSTGERKFLLAAGSAGIEAATNIVVKKAWTQMLLLVYAAVIVLCFITFRSWRAVVVAVVPLVITSVLCEALMVALGIGVKVATLPVIALGVGIGVDYALYLLSVQLAQQRAGVPLAEAYRRALQFTGKVVVLVGVTLGRRRGYLGAVADQVPGRHGHPAGLHVRVEHGRCRGADSGAVALPAADEGVASAAPVKAPRRVASWLVPCTERPSRRWKAWPSVAPMASRRENRGAPSKARSLARQPGWRVQGLCASVESKTLRPRRARRRPFLRPASPPDHEDTDSWARTAIHTPSHSAQEDSKTPRATRSGSRPCCPRTRQSSRSTAKR